VRRYWVFLITSVVLIVGTFVATIAAGNSPVLGLDLQGGVSVVKSPVGRFNDESLELTKDLIRDRVDTLGTLEPDITRQGDDIVIDLPGVKDRERAIRLVGKTAELRFRPVLAVLPAAGDPTPTTTSPTTTTGPSDATTTTAPPTTTTTVPADESAARDAATAAIASCDPAAVLALERVPTTRLADDRRGECVVLESREGDVRYLLGPTALTGDGVSDANARFQSGAAYVVDMELGDEGAAAFDRLAAQQFAQPSPFGDPAGHGAIAITLDSLVQSAPVVNEPSFGGSVQISGSSVDPFTQEEARDLARLIDGGRLPVRLRTVTVQDVSPTLGSDQLRAGIIAGVIGLALVALYMLVFYRVLGLVVIFGLVLSGMALYTVVTYLGSSANLTLTLAGVTGIIVSAGVTVDSYIVYFERLKDEVRAGATVRTCADRAFHRSFRTILAADFVSLIGAGILYWLAIGNVRGFAFFLGLSTIIDLVLSYFVMYPLVVIMSRHASLVRMKGVGIAAGLDAPGVMA
jgi:preprotein translocase subunit SecD